MKKKILYIDLDGVIADFDKAIEAISPGINSPESYADIDARAQRVTEICMAYPEIFQELEPIEGAVEIIKELFNDFDVYFLSAPMWHVPLSFAGKRIWIEDHFGEMAKRKLILTHRKDLAMGDILIDDRLVNGAKDFKGEFIHFRSERFPDWATTVKYLHELNINAV